MTKYLYKFLMSTGSEFRMIIEGESTEQRDVRLQYFLQQKRDNELFYLDKSTGFLYNKEHIVEVKPVGEIK